MYWLVRGGCMFKVREVVIAIGGDTEMEAGDMHRPPGVGGFLPRLVSAFFHSLVDAFVQTTAHGSSTLNIPFTVLKYSPAMAMFRTFALYKSVSKSQYITESNNRST